VLCLYALAVSRPFLKETVAVLLLGFALAVLWTWPLLPQLGSALPYDARFTEPSGSDMHIWVWDFWWTSEAVAGHGDFFFSEKIFLPNGHSLALHTHVFLWGLLTLPLQWLGGPVFAVGAAFLLLFASSFGAMWALLRTLGITRFACGFGAFAWAFSPYFLQKSLEHMDFGATPWPPLFLLFLLKWMHAERRAWKPALATGLVFGLTLLTSPLGSFSTLVLGLLTFLFAPRIPMGVLSLSGPRRSRVFEPVALLGALTIATIVGWPWIREVLNELYRVSDFLKMYPQFGDSIHRQTLAYAQLVDFFRLPGLNPIVASLSQEGALPGVPPDAPLGWNELSWLYISVALLPLAIFALWKNPRVWAWGGLAFGLFLVVWDPAFGGGERVISGFFRALPGMGTLRIPARFFPYFFLPFVALAAWGLQRVQQHSKPLATFLVVFLGVENWVGSYPVMQIETPVAISLLREVEDVHGVLTLPVQYGAGQAMTWQATHKKPVLFSYIARVNPRALYLWKETAPDLYSLAVPTFDESGLIRVPDAMALGLDLQHVGIDHILVDATDSEFWGPCLEVLSELLDGLANWERVAVEGDLLWWRYRS
jgi:hypothetical protein